jgi:hypothetical protein
MLDLKYEDDIEVAVSTIESVLGKQGRMLPSGTNVLYNVKISGPKNVVLWYGDIDISEDSTRISALASNFGFGLIARTEHGKNDQLYPIMTGFVI